MHATCYVIWVDGSQNYFSFFYENDEPAGFPSINEFILHKCIEIFPQKTRDEIKWIIKE